MTSPGTSYDVVVVGAGIVGLAHAYHARRRGLSVAVVEHNDQVAGASVRNFGHACMTAQSGQALDYARAGRRHWLDLAGKAGFWAAPTGTTTAPSQRRFRMRSRTRFSVSGFSSLLKTTRA